jgi:predicted transposase YbfD/YdcC
LVLTLLLLAKMAGEEHIAGIAQWVREREGLLRQWLPLVHAPCANTYRYVCAHVDVACLQEALAAVFMHAPGVQPIGEVRHLACDGKELRGSHRLTAAGVQAAQGVLGIYDTGNGQMEALLPIESKGYESRTFRKWLAHSSVRNSVNGALLTLDALHTQGAVCKAVRKAGADYLLVVKHNQRQLCEDIAHLFSQPPDFWFPERSAQEVASGHGRTAVYTIRLSDELNDYLADRWSGVQQVFQVDRKVTRRSRQGEKVTCELVYGFTSLPANRASPKQVLGWLRRHWHIENRSHWRRDATLGEDRLQLSCKTAALVISLLNCFLLALFDHLDVSNCRQAMRRFNAHPETAIALLTNPL